jgi:hypothetical protein
VSADGTILTPEIQARAVEIADSMCRSDVECYGVLLGGLDSGRYGLTDEHQLEVAMLEEASDELREAFEYLQSRGLAVLERDNECDVIVLKGEA